MIFPNFLIIGAAKAGTTSLYYYLKQHPEIYLSSLKEPHFFSFEGEKLTFRRPGNLLDPINETAVTCLEDYHALFENVSNQKAIGEASPSYLHTPKAAKRIKFYIPDAKLIAILRHPAERAYSAFMGEYLSSVEKKLPYISDFSEALALEEKFIQEKWSPIFYYQKLGFYYEQISYYLQFFEPHQLHICLNEDLQNDPTSTLQKIFRFLNIDDQFIPDTSVRAGASGVPKSQFIYRFMRQKRVKSILKPFLPKGIGQKFDRFMLSKPPLSPENRDFLINLYRNDILKLQGLINRDLSPWLR